MCEERKVKSKNIRGTLIEAPDVAGGPPSRKRTSQDKFIWERRQKEKEGIRSLGEEEVVGRVVEGGKNIKKIKEEKREKKKKNG